MTDNDVIKALECCAKLTHNGWGDNMKICQEQCPYKANCYDEEKNINMISDALDLINRQQAEIERLQKVKEQIKKEKNKILDAQMFLAKICDDLEEKLKTTKSRTEVKGVEGEWLNT